MATRYYVSLPDAAKARGANPELSFTAQGAEALAEELQSALRSDGLFERWRKLQPEPDEVDAAFGATDPTATVEGKQDDLHVDLVVNTSLPGAVFKHRLRLLAGGGWELRDVTAA